MGRVLLALDPVLDRRVAVKLLRDDLRIPADQRQALFERMRHEARASARVTHPNIVTLHDMGEDAELGLYLVFEYADGVTLKERLKRGPLGPSAAARLGRELGGALTTAHLAGVLHRDVKPENVILTDNGAKIADFGIARVPDSTLTRDGGLLGTPAYSAPEAIAGGRFSPLSDQFSMAATLYEAISGYRAFPGDDAVAVATRIANDRPQSIARGAGLDQHVDQVLDKALDKNPRNRFESCAEFGRALAEALEVVPRAAMPTMPDEHHRRLSHKATRRDRLAWVSCGVVVGALCIFGANRLHTPDDPLPAPLAPEHPVGWLSESPAAPDRSPVVHGATHAEHARVDLGLRAGAATLDAGVDAGRAPRIVEAGAPPAASTPVAEHAEQRRGEHP